jgi:cobalamin synthase
VEVLRRGTRPASTGLARIGPVGAIAAIAAFAFEIWCVSRITDDAGRAAAIVMAMMLSRWAIIAIGYGLKPLEHWGLGIPYEGGISFREFSVSSAVALGLTMGLYQNVGLAVIVALALTILAARLVLSRRMGGASGYMLAGGCALVEVVTFVVLAALGT